MTTKTHTATCVVCERSSVNDLWMTWRVKYLTLLLLHHHKDEICQTIRASRSIWSVECLTEAASSFKASRETLTISAAASTSAGITLHFHFWVKHPGDCTPLHPCMFDLSIVLDKGFTWWPCSRKSSCSRSESIDESSSRVQEDKHVLTCSFPDKLEAFTKVLTFHGSARWGRLFWTLTSWVEVTRASPAQPAMKHTAQDTSLLTDVFKDTSWILAGIRFIAVLL